MNGAGGDPDELPVKCSPGCPAPVGEQEDLDRALPTHLAFRTLDSGALSSAVALTGLL